MLNEDKLNSFRFLFSKIPNRLYSIFDRQYLLKIENCIVFNSVPAILGSDQYANFSEL